MKRLVIEQKHAKEESARLIVNVVKLTRMKRAAVANAKSTVGELHFDCNYFSKHESKGRLSVCKFTSDARVY